MLSEINHDFCTLPYPLFYEKEVSTINRFTRVFWSRPFSKKRNMPH